MHPQAVVSLTCSSSAVASCSASASASTTAATALASALRCCRISRKRCRCRQCEQDEGWATSSHCRCIRKPCGGRLCRTVLPAVARLHWCMPDGGRPACRAALHALTSETPPAAASGCGWWPQIGWHPQQSAEGCCPHCPHGRRWRCGAPGCVCSQCCHTWLRGTGRCALCHPPCRLWHHLQSALLLLSHGLQH